MALEVWYKSDIQNALRAAELANSAALNAADNRDDPFVNGYQAGYRSALTTLALAFGLSVVPGPKSDGLQEFGNALSSHRSWTDTTGPTRPRGDRWLADKT